LYFFASGILSYFAITLLASAALLGQEFRGTFSGQVRARRRRYCQSESHRHTKRDEVKAETLSSETGEYTIPFLTPGEYEIAAEIAGFKTHKREGLTLGILAAVIIHPAPSESRQPPMR
jgi:hypothetical protein